MTITSSLGFFTFLGNLAYCVAPLVIVFWIFLLYKEEVFGLVFDCLAGKLHYRMNFSSCLTSRP